MLTSRVTSLSLAVALVACGKGTKDQPRTTESKVAEAGASSTAAGGTAVASTTKPAVAPTKAPARGPERAVYSLVDSRLSAHLTRGGGLLLPAGSAGFAKYLRFGNQMSEKKKAWDLRASEGNVKVAAMTGKSASVFVPLTAAQAARPTVRIRIHSSGDGTLSLRVNDNKDINANLASGWTTLELTVPADQLKEGENQLTLFTKPGEAKVAWMQVGGAQPIGDDGAVQFYDTGKKALVLPKDSGMSWYVMVPDKAKLAGDLSDGSCTVGVLATAEDGSTAEGKLTGTGSAVDLGSLAGKAVRLDLDGQGCATSELANAALVIPGTVPAIKRGEPPKNIVFIIMDSLRADRVRPWNAKARPETPNFDKLAETGAVFLNNYVQGNESQVSHAAMWTSMYLAKHKAPNMKDTLADKFVTIDEVAKKAGKFVAGVSANGYIRPKRGYGSAWDKYVNHIESSMGLRGADILDKGLSFITPKKDQPWFLYMGLIDTHVTLRAKAPWLEKYDGGYKGKFATSFGDDGGGGMPKGLSEKEMEHVRALYDSNVSYQDDLLGQLLKKLEEWGVKDQTMIVITADHGDEQWEDGRFGHGGSVRETLVHVPLLIHYPPLFPASKVAEGTEGIDIVPTLADALGVAHDPEWQGMSLLPLAHGAGGYPLMSFGSKYENGHAGRIGHWKGMLNAAASPRIYNLAKDAGETKDLYGTAHVGTRLLLDAMWMQRQWNVEWKKSQWGNAASVSSRFAADLGE
ncbi:MAG TPA: sulfatase-like hydrolase/transferase [Kofleriaceae bacterium]|nr:sulfatase-like hydrolase/transferase [Kofleriaceae bacterium]